MSLGAQRTHSAHGAHTEHTTYSWAHSGIRTAGRAQVSLPSGTTHAWQFPLAGLQPGGLPANGQTDTHITAGKRPWQPPVS